MRPPSSSRASVTRSVPMGATRCCLDGLVRRLEGLEPVAGAGRARPKAIAASARLDAAAGSTGRSNATRTSIGAGGPGGDRLRGVGVGVGDLERACPFPAGRCPSRAGRCGRQYNEPPAGRDRQSATIMSEAGDERRPADVAVRRLHQLGPPDLAPREPGDERVPSHDGGPNDLLRPRGLVEDQAAGRLVLRAEADDRRLVVDVRQVLVVRGAGSRSAGRGGCGSARRAGCRPAARSPPPGRWRTGRRGG